MVGHSSEANVDAGVGLAPVGFRQTIERADLLPATMSDPTVAMFILTHKRTIG